MSALNAYRAKKKKAAGTSSETSDSEFFPPGAPAFQVLSLHPKKKGGGGGQPCLYSRAQHPQKNQEIRPWGEKRERCGGDFWDAAGLEFRPRGPSPRMRARVDGGKSGFGSVF